MTKATKRSPMDGRDFGTWSFSYSLPAPFGLCQSAHSTCSCTEAMGKSPIDDGDDDAWGFPLSTCSCIPLWPSLTYVSQPKALVTSKGYHYIIAGSLATYFMLVCCSIYSSIVKMDMTCSSEMSVDFQWATRCYIPEDRSLHSHVFHVLFFFVRLN
jgi:hypothetical protein